MPFQLYHQSLNTAASVPCFGQVELWFKEFYDMLKSPIILWILDDLESKRESIGCLLYP